MNISIVSILLTTLLALFPLLFFAWLRVKWSKKAIVGVLRMAFQLAVVGIYMKWLWQIDSIALDAAWLTLMSILAALLIVNKARLNVGRMLLPVTASVFIGTAVLTIYLWFVISPLLPALTADVQAIQSSTRSLNTSFIIPIAAILMTGITTTCTLALREYFVSLQRFNSTYYYHKGNGLSWFQSISPILRRAVSRAFLPSIAQMMVMGIATLPTLLGGLLLGGMQPLHAVLAVCALTLATLCGAVITFILVILLSKHIATDKWGSLTLSVRRSTKVVLPVLLLLLTACNNQNQESKNPNHSEVKSNRTETFKSNYAPSKPQENTVSTRQTLEIPAPMKGAKEIILKRKAYTVSYNPDTKIPNWVAWHLTDEHTRGTFNRHENIFHEDMDVPAPRADDNDYYNSRFDRGHMCPAGDSKWDKRALEETFLFTNICPQNHGFNAGVWNDLEKACRRWAREYDDLYIVCGPILTKNKQETQTIGRHKVVVPERFFKVILATKDEPKAIGFVYYNNAHNSEQMFKNATTVDEVERLTGIDFFPVLNDKTEMVIEAERGYF